MSSHSFIEELKPVKFGNNTYIGDCNVFFPVSEEEIIQAEQDLKIQFPSQLKKFYQEIGYGFLTHPHKIPKGYSFPSINRINSPAMIADIMLNGADSGLIIDDFFKDLQPGDLPFFEIGDSSRFLIMKLQSDNRNAVWSVSGIKIEDSFEKFIERLYCESPWFYDDIIENHYKNLSA